MKTRKSHYILLVFFALLFSIEANAQKTLAKGNAYFDRNMFKEAIPYFEEEMKAGDNKSKEEATERLADCYRLIGEFQKAEEYYKKLVSRAKKNPEHQKNYALSLKASSKYQEAAEEFKKYARLNPSDPMASVYIESCGLAQKWLDESIGNEVKNLGFLNTEYSEFSPTFYKGGFLFCSARPGSKRKVVTFGSETNNPSLDFFYVNLQKPYDSLATEVFENSARNTYLHEGPATFTPTGDTIYFTRSVKGARDDKKGVILKVLHVMESHRTPEGWSNPVSAFSFNGTNYSVGHPSLSANGKTIYFMSDMPGGKGGTDIYRSEKQSDGTWGPAINLGSEVNTFAFELFPFIYDDNTLYFSSDGHPGMGKLDVFIAIKDNNEWKSVSNVRPPINSIGDDFGFIMDKKFRQGLFSSDRFDSKGLEDIYAFSDIAEITITVDGGKIRIPNNTLFDGLKFKLIDNTSKVETVLNPVNGEYQFTPELNKPYTISIRKDGFNYNKIDFTLIRNTERSYMELDITSKLKTIKVDGFLKEDRKDTSGNVSYTPQSGATVELLKNGNPIDLTMSDNKGYFTHKSIIVSGTPYKLIASKSKKKAESEFSLLGEVGSQGSAIEGASIKLFKDGNLVETVTSNGNGLYSFRARLLTGSNYSVSVEKDGYTPAKMDISAADFKTEGGSIYKKVDLKPMIREDKNIVAGNTENPESGQPLDPPVLLKGSVMNRKNKFIANAVVTLKQGNKVIKQLTTNADGDYSVYIKKKGDYMVITSYEGYLPNDMKVAVYDNKDTLVSITHILEKIELNKTVRMDNIYYDYNKATVRFESLPALDVLVEFMMKNPKVKIELSSHTDERGYDDYNLNLSQGRAKNAAMYLILEDIENNRIVYKGYGETKPLIKNAKTEDEHQLNRRTEFKVIAVD